jgi:hypothetical protein
MYNPITDEILMGNVKYNFHFISFIIGLLLGMIMMLIIIWISYYTRTFLFTYCSTQAVKCGLSDYFINPGNALAFAGMVGLPGLTASDILFVETDKNGDEKMYYDVVAKSNSCVSQKHVRYIPYPQYCTFFDKDGNSGTYKKNLFNLYALNGEQGVRGIPALVDCQPIPADEFTGGEILIKWDPNPI